MASSDAATRPSLLDDWWKFLPLLILIAMAILSFAKVAEQVKLSFSCERHLGAFSNAFSIAFDINRTDCRLSGVEDSPTIHLWEVPPYVGIDW
jgi:hypothetical protein